MNCKELILASLILAGLHISVEPTPGVTYYRVGGDYSCLQGGLKVPARPDGSLRLDVDCVGPDNMSSPITVRSCNTNGCSPHITLDASNQVPKPPKAAVEMR